jgi:hypothetical protein
VREEHHRRLVAALRRRSSAARRGPTAVWTNSRTRWSASRWSVAMMPYQVYQLYQAERPKSAVEIRR